MTSTVLSSASKVEVFFKFILMHLNSIVPVGILAMAS
jgi:hypothetical protein